MTRHQVDTVDVLNVDELAVDLWYPRVDERYKSIRISLMDVRAANDIKIKYDFDRDGWVVLSDLYDPSDEWWKRSQEELDAESEKETTYHEVAFIPAWPQRKDYPNADNQERAGGDVRGGIDPWPPYLVG